MLSEVFNTGPLRSVNPIVKGYAILFVLLFAAFFGTDLILVVTSIAVLVIVLLSKVSLRMLWRMSRIYLAVPYPLLLFFSLLELQSTHEAFLQATKTYVRFIDVIVVGAVYAITTNPTDLTLVAFRYKFQKLGIALAAGFAALPIMREKIKLIVSLQKLRGVEYSLNPLKFKNTLKGIEALAVPIVLQAVDLSHNYALSMVARGYNSKKRIHLPPNLAFKTSDLIISVLATIFLLMTLIGGS